MDNLCYRLSMFALQRGGWGVGQMANVVEMNRTVTAGHRIPKRIMTEKDFQGRIVKFAKMMGWHVYHTHDSRRSEPGFPDLVLAKDRVMYRELKSEKGKLTIDQKAWAASLQRAGADYSVWRPSQLQAIYSELMGGK